jgi:CheY-like chemotaxis protein
MKKILIVEDNAMNMELFSDLLIGGGYEVLKAESAEEGIRLAAANQPDLVLMDISLASMDGLAATQLLKKDRTTRHLPIVALTAHAMPGDKEKAINAGCSGYITKPIDTRTFVKTVARLAQGVNSVKDGH